MEIFHRLYLGCLGGTGVSLVFTIFLFVKYDIRTAWRVLTGRKDRKRKSSPKDIQPTMNQKDTEAEQKTDLLVQKKESFYVEREVMLIHADTEL